jgi:hypothetical protein
MRWMRILILALVLSVMGWSAPTTSFAEGQDNPKVKMVSGKNRKKKPVKKGVKKVRKKKKKKGKVKRVKKPKKPVKKKKKTWKEPKWSVGVRGAATPAASMSVERSGMDNSKYSPRLAFGAGLVTQYRVFDKPSVYILGEFTHWWHELKDQKTAKKDSLITISTGVRVNVWGQANKARHRVFVKGLVGYTYYAANKGNAWSKGGKGAADRSGIYFGGGLGYEHLFKALPISVFVDTGVYNHNFNVDPANSNNEKGASLLSWEVGAGVMYHF